MKTSIILSIASVLMTAIVVFFFAGQQTAVLKSEFERQRAQAIAKEWRLQNDTQAVANTLFSRELFTRYTAPSEKSVQLGTGPALYSTGFMALATISACNPRIKPCF